MNAVFGHILVFSAVLFSAENGYYTINWYPSNLQDTQHCDFTDCVLFKAIRVHRMFHLFTGLCMLSFMVIAQFFTNTH